MTKAYAAQDVVGVGCLVGSCGHCAGDIKAVAPLLCAGITTYSPN